MVILGNFACAIFICNIACGEGITHRKMKLSDMHGYEANELKRARKDAVQVFAPNITQALGTDSSSFTTEYAKEDDPNDNEMEKYEKHCVNLLKFVRNGCDPLWLNGTLCQDELQVSNKESDVEKLQESKGGSKCNNSKESCIENAAASPDQYLDDATRTIHDINSPTATENTKSNQDQGLNVNVDFSLPKNLPTNHSDENHVAESLPNIEEAHGTYVPQTASKTPRVDGIEYSYLSFGVNSSIPSFYTCVINAEERISSREKSKNSADGETSNNDQNHAKYAFSRIIDIKNSENNILETMIKKEMLFGSIEGMVGKIKTKSIDLDKLVNESKNQESLYAFFENLNVKVYSCKSIQDLYFLFITYICLEYNLFLKCWVLREELWEAHVYMSELYPYTLWKMEKINTENEITLENREIYKQNLKEELKLLCIILELYREIKILKIKPDSCSKHQSLINIHIEKLRKVIQMHLESFYASERATSLCYIGSKLSNFNVPQYNLDRIQNLYLIDGRFLGLSKQLTAHSNLPVKETYSWLQQKQSELAFIYDVNQVNIYKTILPILGFTVNFANKGLQISDLKTIKSKEVENGKKMPPYRLLQSCVFNLNQRIKAFESTLIDWLCFIKLIREKHFSQKSDGTHDSDKFGILQFKCAMDEYNLAGILTQPQRLILLRNMIKRVLSIKL